MDQPENETADGLMSRLLRLYRRPYVHTAVGVLVLAAIITTLVIISRVTGEGSSAKLVDISGTPGGGSTGGESVGLGPLDGGAPKVGQPAPDFALRGPDGNVHRLSDFRGQVVFLNFWATWCPPCRRELSDIQTVYDQKKDEGLVVLEVDFQESASDVQGYWDERGLTMPVLLDSSGQVTEQQYKLVGLPGSFFVDRDGVLRDIHLGAISKDDMLKKLEKAGLP